MERCARATGTTSTIALVRVLRRGIALLPPALCVFACAPSPAFAPALATVAAANAPVSANMALPSNAARFADETRSAGGTRFSVGGGAAGAWAADPGPTSGSTYPYGFSNRVDTSRIAEPAPDAVYQRSRFGTHFAYTVDSLRARGRYIVRLHFVEPSWHGARRRIFDVSVNGATVLRRFDIFATAGGAFRAVTRSFTSEASSAGTITIAFSAVRDTAIVSGIEVLRDAPPPPAKVDVAALEGEAFGTRVADE